MLPPVGGTSVLEQYILLITRLQVYVRRPKPVYVHHGKRAENFANFRACSVRVCCVCFVIVLFCVFVVFGVICTTRTVDIDKGCSVKKNTCRNVFVHCCAAKNLV